MALNARKIKDKSVEVDRDSGEAKVTITLYARGRNEIRTRVSTDDIIPIAHEGGAEVIGVIKDDSISNINGEATGIWIFKIPTTDPENSTTTILKRRSKKATTVVEEDWNLGPEE